LDIKVTRLRIFLFLIPVAIFLTVLPAFSENSVDNAAASHNWQKLNEVPLVQNPDVERDIALIKERGKSFLEKVQKRQNELLSTSRDIIVSEKSPSILLNVVLIFEYLGKTGEKDNYDSQNPWNLSPETARLYGLRVDHQIDERSNIRLSTQASLRYLKHLFDIFGDWYLAMAAFLSSPADIKEAIALTDSYNLWEIARRGNLPSGARNFVSKFIALSILLGQADIL